MQNRIKALEGLIDNAHITAFLRNDHEDGVLDYMSAGIRDFGYRPEDFTSGKIRFRDLIHPDDADRAYLELKENALEGSAGYTQRYRIITKRGSIRVVEERTTFMRDENRKVIYYQGILEDITDKKEQL